MAEAVGSFFPDVDASVIAGGVARYKEQDTWAEDPLLREDGFDTLQNVLVEAGLAKSRQPL